jgi:prevent-host-death family protein
MKKVGIRKLKNRLSKYLAQARKGTTIVVTDRGEPVAKIIPIENQAQPEDAIEARLRELAAAGSLRLPTRPFRPVLPARVKGKPVSRTIIEDIR